MAKVPNRQVVRELKEGNRLGCSHLVELYQDRLLGEAVHVFQVPFSDAEELVSDVLLAVVDKIGSFEFKRSDADFHYWVVTIFRNRVRDFVRHRALTEGLLQYFQESEFENDDELTPTGREVVATIVRDYEESFRHPDNVESSAVSLRPAPTRRRRSERDEPRSPSRPGEANSAGEQGTMAGKLQMIADTLEGMETWERVLLRCRALDVPYEEIARYTGKTAKQLKVYHARVKKKFIKLLSQHYPELTIP